MSFLRVRIQFGDGRVEDRSLPLGRVLVGREAGDLILSDGSISSRHAELQVEAGRLIVTDLGSTNGSFDQHGHRLAGPMPLHPGQWVRLGNCTLQLLAPAATTARGTEVMPQYAARAPQPAAPAQQPAPQPAAHVQQPAAHVQQPAAHVQQPAAHVQQPAAHVQQPAAHAPQPAAHAPLHGQAPVYGGTAAPPGALAAGALAAAPFAAAPQAAAPQAAAPHAAAPFAAAPQATPAPAPARSAPNAGTASSGFSHPQAPVRHSYPLVPSGFGVGAAAGLLMKTAPFLGVRLGILFGMSVLALVFWLVVLVGFVMLAKVSVIGAWGWLILAGLVASGIWRAAIRYFLYLLKAAHIAVLTELITSGRVGNGSEGMFAYGKRIVRDRFGQVNVLFAVDVLVDGVVRTLNRTLDWVSQLIPVPGLDSVVGFVKAVLRASTTYIDETIFSYNLARGDENVFRSSKDALVYYAQNTREVLKTGVWVVILEKVLSTLVFIVFFLPSLVMAHLLPASFGFWAPVTAVVMGWLFAVSVQQAVLRPLFLTMVMLKFHAVVQNQPINAEWDQRLDGLSEQFRQLKQKADSWTRAPAGAPAAQPLPAG